MEFYVPLFVLLVSLFMVVYELKFKPKKWGMFLFLWSSFAIWATKMMLLGA